MFLHKFCFYPLEIYFPISYRQMHFMSVVMAYFRELSQKTYLILIKIQDHGENCIKADSFGTVAREHLFILEYQEQV